VSEWQPIETAPKDGTLIWVVDEKHTIHIAFWQSKWNWKRFKVDRTFQAVWSHDIPAEREDGEKVNATDWMPLPLPPTEAPSL